MIACYVTDFSVFDPHEGRLSNLVQQFPSLRNPITEYVQATPEDNIAERQRQRSLSG
jgi:hypothetical protein